MNWTFTTLRLINLKFLATGKLTIHLSHDKAQVQRVSIQLILCVCVCVCVCVCARARARASVSLCTIHSIA